MLSEIVALSVDSLEQAQQTVEWHGLSFPVLYGLDVHQVEKSIGANINTDPPYLQATDFVLRPDGTVAVAVYSSGAIGRLVAADTVNYLKSLQKAQSQAGSSNDKGSGCKTHVVTTVRREACELTLFREPVFPTTN